MHIPMGIDRIIEQWVKEYAATMNMDGLRVGDDSGDVPPGIRITFDGYAEGESPGSSMRKNMLSFAVFIHKDSMSGTFPEHDSQAGYLMHRPDEEICIYAWVHTDREEGSQIEVLTDDLEFSSPVLERKLRRVVYDIYRRELRDSTGKRIDSMAGFGKLDANHQSVFQWIVNWRENGEKEETSLDGGRDGVSFTVEAKTLGERFTVSLPEDAFKDYPKGSNKVVVETSEFGELKKANIDNLVTQVTTRKEFEKASKKKSQEKKSRKGSLDVAAKRAEVIGQIQDRINARNQRYEVYFCPDVYKGPKSAAELRKSLEGLHKAAFELLDNEVVSDFCLVFTPAVCDRAPSPFIAPKSNGNYVVLGFNFAELELVEMLAIPSCGAVGMKGNEPVGVYVAMTLNREGINYDAARKIAKTDVQARKRWQISEESSKLKNAIVNATALLGLQIGWLAAKYSDMPMNMFIPTLVPDESSSMLVQQSIDPSLGKATGDPSIKASFLNGFFSTTDPVKKQKYIVGYDEGNTGIRTKKCTEFHRYLLSTSALSIKKKEFNGAPWIEIVDTPEEYSFDVYPASKIETREAVEGKAVVIDVRDAAQFAKSNIHGSINIPYKGLDANRYRVSSGDSFDLSKLPKDRKSTLVVIGSGVAGDWNSYKAVLACRKAGFKAVIWYPGRL